MNEKKIDYLLKYLELLLKAHQEGCKSFQEIAATTKSIAFELGLDAQRGITLQSKDGAGTVSVLSNGNVTVTGNVVLDSTTINSEKHGWRESK